MSLTVRQLGNKLRGERGSRGVREVAKEIGVSPATLSRVERGNLPDLDTFAKMCRWLKVDPATILDVDVSQLRQGPTTGSAVLASAHFRGGATMDPEIANALAELIISARQFLERQTTEEL